MDEIITKAAKIIAEENGLSSQEIQVQEVKPSEPDTNPVSDREVMEIITNMW